MVFHSQRSRKSRHTYRSLEPRRLLAGDVTVFHNADNVYLRGDRADNQVEVIGNDDGSITVRGVDGTTINQQDELTLETSNATIGHLGVHTGPGNDRLFVEGINIEGSAIVRTGTGDDTVGLYKVTTGRDLIAQTWSGDDSISLDEVTVGNRLVAYTFGGADTIGIDQSTVEGATLISTHSGADRIAVRNSIHEGSVFAFTGSGSDFASFDGVEVGSFSALLTENGHDDVVLQDTSFDRGLFANGGRGFDNLEDLGGNEFNGFTFVRSFEGSDVEDEQSRRDEVFSDLILDGARLGTIAELAALTPDLSTLLGALQATGLDAAVAGDGPLTVFAPLNSAFEQISDIVAGLTIDQLADVLTFHVAAGEIFASELVTLESVDTLLGQSFSVEIIDGEVILNGNVTLAATDIRAKNGVIHLLNEVLIP